MLPTELLKYRIPDKASDLIPEEVGNKIGRVVNAIGDAPPVIIVERRLLVYGFMHFTRPAMEDKFKQQ
jgi:hypothetical protein